MRGLKSSIISLLSLLFLTELSLILCDCGVLSLTSGVPPNDPAPSGAIVYQGNFTGLNGNTVSGVVSVYRNGCYDASNCIYIVRLQGLSAPQTSNTLVIPTINGTPPLTPGSYALRNSSGTQNYTFTGAPSAATWTQVTLHPGSSPIGQNDYGIATLVGTGNTGGTGIPPSGQ